MNAPQNPASSACSPPITRRTFVKQSAVGLTALSAGRVLGANERIGIGLIGFGLIGRIHTRSFLAQSDTQFVAVADTYQPRIDAAVAMMGGRATRIMTSGGCSTTRMSMP